MTRPIAGTIPTQAHDHTLKHCCHSQLSKAFEALYAFKSHAAEHLRTFVGPELGIGALGWLRKSGHKAAKQSFGLTLHKISSMKATWSSSVQTGSARQPAFPTPAFVRRRRCR